MKKVISILLLITLIVSLSVPVYADISYVDGEGNVVKLDDFLDTKGHWAHDVIKKWSEFNLVAGYNGNFMPDNPIIRGDLCVILDRLLGLETVSYNFYNDLSNESYFTNAVLKCVAAGYVAGTSSTTVDPGGYATREQMATILCRIFDIDTSNTGSVKRYNDDAKISSWAKPSIYALRRLGYMNGDGNNVYPTNSITRAEVIQMLDNIAGIYIPSYDMNNQGSTFKSDFERNVMVARYIELINSSVGRDLYILPSARGITLRNTNIRGRLFVLAKSGIDLTKCTIGQIYLKDGKTSVSGIDDGVSEVYVAKYASESSLDKIPTKLVLEPGVRVVIDGTFYENTSNENKIYYGIDIKNDIAAEQNYVSGGPRISSVRMTQGVDNIISVENARITNGSANVAEIGVVWKYQYDKTVLPTYQNKDGYVKYNSTNIENLISFDVGTVSGTRVYRMYARDSSGLYAYSDPFTFTAYDYNMNLKIYNKDYPKSLDVELVLQGNNLPNISSIRVVYGTDEVYNENRDYVSLSKFTTYDTEYQLDDAYYRRYTSTLYVQPDKDGVYTAPTHFGYIITFSDGTILNRYPVLSNVVPEGVSPMGELKTGTGTYDINGKIVVKNNVITTRYTLPQEVGIIYKVSDSESVGTPTAGANGWKTISSYLSIGLGESRSFNVTIDPNTYDGYTYYATYVKTSNGYIYGDVKKISNDSRADEGAKYFINNASLYSLDDTQAILILDVNSDLTDKDVVFLNDVETSVSRYVKYNYNKKVYIFIYDYKKDSMYNIRIVDTQNKKSNIFVLTNDMFKQEKIYLKYVKSDKNYDFYTLYSNTFGTLIPKEVKFINESVFANIEDSYIYVNKGEDIKNKDISVSYYYYISRPSSYFYITQVIHND